MQLNRQTVSICMCTYNGAAYLRELLESILSQSQLPDEIIIYDDHSVDETSNILQEYMDMSQNIRWVFHKNSENVGWRENFKRCMEHATGDIVFLCDQDDIWDSQKIEIMSAAFRDNHSIGLLSSGYRPLVMQGAHETNLKSRSTHTKEIKKVELAPRGFYYTVGCTYAFRKSLIAPFVKCWDPEIAHDGLLWYLALSTDSLYRIDYEALLFRRHENNASSHPCMKKNSLEMRDYIEGQQRVIERIKQCVPLSKEATKLLNSMGQWYELRKKLFLKGRLIDFVRLYSYRKYYSSYKNYLCEANAIIYRKRKGNGNSKSSKSSLS